MGYSPTDAKNAVTLILSQVDREHEAAYLVIFRAVKVCAESGMSRRETARFLGLKARRINRNGQYVRSAKAVRSLFRNAYSVRDYTSDPSPQDMAEFAWMESGQI